MLRRWSMVVVVAAMGIGQRKRSYKEAKDTVS